MGWNPCELRKRSGVLKRTIHRVVQLGTQAELCWMKYTKNKLKMRYLLMRVHHSCTTTKGRITLRFMSMDRESLRDVEDLIFKLYFVVLLLLFH